MKPDANPTSRPVPYLPAHRRRRLLYIHRRLTDLRTKFPAPPTYWTLATELGLPWHKVVDDVKFLSDELGLSIESKGSEACLRFVGNVCDALQLVDRLYAYVPEKEEKHFVPISDVDSGWKEAA